MRAGNQDGWLSAGGDAAPSNVIAAARSETRPPADEDSKLKLAGGHSLRSAAPVRIGPAALPANVSADDAFNAVLAVYAPAIAENLRCVLTSADPEGPHQLRVALRRLRTVLRIFKPVTRRTLNQRLAWCARYIGAIVGELRDTDVMIEEMIRPAAAPEEVGLVRALELWREDTRARVRASLLAARATAFTTDLLQVSEKREWRRARAKRSKHANGPAQELVEAALELSWTRAAERGARLTSLSAFERHELRKDVKALRYSAELAVTASPASDASCLAAALKRIQDALGYLNDLDTLERFDPPLPGDRDALVQVRRRLIAERAQSVADVASSAAARWLALASARFASAAASAA